jgi:hypothetical protein
VGTINSGKGTVISAHYPSNLDFDKKMKWNIGISNAININSENNIWYPFANNGYIEFSGYLRTDIIWFTNLSSSLTSIKEKISFQQSSTFVGGMTGQLGVRKALRHDRGFIEGTLIFPGRPYYSNGSFPFKTGIVPSYSLSWIKNRFMTSQINTYLSIMKNIKKKHDVFLDNDIQLTAYSEHQLFNLYISPYLTAQYQKLIAPISLYDNNRDARILGFIFGGFSIMPLQPKYDFLQINFNVPIYSWVSKIGFPDGTVPHPSITISLFSNGVFKKKRVKDDSIPNIFK